MHLQLLGYVVCRVGNPNCLFISHLNKSHAFGEGVGCTLRPPLTSCCVYEMHWAICLMSKDTTSVFSRFILRTPGLFLHNYADLFAIVSALGASLSTFRMLHSMVSARYLSPMCIFAMIVLVGFGSNCCDRSWQLFIWGARKVWVATFYPSEHHRACGSLKYDPL